MHKESNRVNAGKKSRISQADGDGTCLRCVENVIDILSKKWSLKIISVFNTKTKMRFKELLHALSGISPKTLTDRLRDLEKSGMIRREVFAEIPPRVEYSLTEEGTELRDAMIPLIYFAMRKYHSQKTQV